MKNHHGFTLLEVLIAITLMSFLVLGVYTIIDDNYKSQIDITKEDREYIQTQMAIERLQLDLEQIYSPLYFSAYPSQQSRNPRQQETLDPDRKINNFPVTKYFPKEQVSNLPVPLIEQEDKDEIIFFTSSFRRRMEGQKTSRYAWVKYFLEPDPNDPPEDSQRPGGLSLLKRKVVPELLYEEDIEWDKGPDQLLLKGVKLFAIEFWNPKSEKWVERLREVDAAHKESPRLFRLLLSVIDHAGIEHNYLRVIKPHWPIFDAIAEQKMIDLSQKGNNQTGEGQNQNNSPVVENEI